MGNDTKMLGSLALGLLALMVILGLTFIVGDQYLETICTDIGGNTWSASGSQCNNGTTNVYRESDAFNQTEAVIDAIKLISAFLTVIVLVLIVKVLVQNARSVGE